MFIRTFAVIGLFAGCAAPVESFGSDEKGADGLWDRASNLSAYQSFMQRTVVPRLESTLVTRDQLAGTTEGWFSDVLLDYAVFAPERPNGDAVVVVHGMREAWQHHVELIYDLLDNGYTVYAYSQRGFGASTRLLGDPQKTHIADFFDYARDLRLFMTQVVEPGLERGERRHRNVFGVGHSLGGAVVTTYALMYPHDFRALALSAPMYDIASAPRASWSNTGAQVLGETPFVASRYVPGGAPFVYEPTFVVANNEVTHSEPRYVYKQATWAGMTDVAGFADASLAIGSPTYGWLNEALDGVNHIHRNASSLCTPTQIFSAGDELVVINAAQVEVCSAAQRCSLTTIEGARHELNHELDEYRAEFVSGLLELFSSPPEAVLEGSCTSVGF